MSRARAGVVMFFGAVFVAGVVLAAWGGESAPALVRERTVFLGGSGSIVRVQVGDAIHLELGESSTRPGRWVFTSSAPIVRVTLVHAAAMPIVSPPASGGGDGTQGYVSTTGAESWESPSGAVVSMRLVRITALASGVTTVKGWLGPPGATPASSFAFLPDFVFVVLVER